MSTNFYTYKGVVNAVDKVSFNLETNDALGLVGESGSGKSVTALSVLRLIPYPGKIDEGRIVYKDQDLLKKSEEEMRAIRGAGIGMIFQEPMTSLNPVFTIGSQIADVIRVHQKVTKEKAKEEAIDILRNVRMPDAETLFNRYPHQLSGGMRQRVLIAMALSCRPDLLIADEPTTALDVTIQAQILTLIKELMKEFGLSLLMITHNLGIVREICRRVLVMYAGNIVEEGTTDAILINPKHPYTQSLLQAIPRFGEHPDKLKPVGGTIPDLINPPSGCKFHPRCPYAMDICKGKAPPVVEVEKAHNVRCYLYV